MIDRYHLILFHLIVYCLSSSGFLSSVLDSHSTLFQGNIRDVHHYILTSPYSLTIVSPPNPSVLFTHSFQPWQGFSFGFRFHFSSSYVEESEVIEIRPRWTVIYADASVRASPLSPHQHGLSQFVTLQTSRYPLVPQRRYRCHPQKL